MDFNGNKPIYLQICEHIFERIISGELKTDSKILSVRELGIELGVNPNTVMRSYENLQESGVIYNKRGIGFFISEKAEEIAVSKMKEEFLNQEMPIIAKKIKLLNINIEDLKQYF